MPGTAAQITAAPLHGGDYGSFNWIFLVEYILCGILCLWFLFYFNRIFATLISYLVRLFTWHFFGVYLDIEALQISILAGRVFFKSIRYHGDNETIFLHGGYVTWRYWLRKVKPCRLFHETAARSKIGKHAKSQPSKDTASAAAEEGPPPKADDNLPCRIEVRVSGVEAFIYNRSPAYDYILETCAQHGASASAIDAEARASEQAEKRGSKSEPQPSKESTGHSSSSSTSLGSQIKRDNPTPPPSNLQTQSSDFKDLKPSPPPSWLRLLPVSVYCNKAAAVLGNENTPSILSAKIDSASGNFDASESGPLDVFKILMQFSVTKPVIHIKPNVDYKRPQLVEASLLEASDALSSQATPPFDDKTFLTTQRKTKRSPWTRLPGLSQRAMDSLTSIAKLPDVFTSSENLPDAQMNLPGQGRWLGLTRYLDDNQRSNEDEWKDVEYAKASTLADLNSVDFTFYWDIAGPRPGLRNSSADKGQATTTVDVNGGPPPAYGMELFVHGGTVHYGPWADRHRQFLQQLLFPAPYADAAATSRVRVGDPRLCTIFDLYLSIESDTVLRIPFREPSKDYKWKGRTDNKTSSSKQNQTRHRRRRRNADQAPHSSTHARPYAWFDILVKPNSTIKFKQDMYPTLQGYRNFLRVDVGGLDMHSSLNHALLWRSGNVGVQADLSNPLKWNALHEWTFEIGIDDLDFFLLRDHAVLLMDMIEDWTTGALSEFFTFVPYRYILKPRFERFKLFLNVNDANIVDRSDEIQENEFTILYGRQLISELLIPIDRLRPSESSIFFDVTAYDLGFELSMPPKNTLSAFLKDKDVAQLPQVDLKGDYVLRSEVRSDLSETLHMKIVGRGLVIAFYGFFARHLAKIKENYFGDDVHFRTLQEYQELVRNDFHSNEPQAPIRGNDLDVILDITAEDVHILLPSGLYSCKDYVELFVDTANVDLRVNNYFLELMVDSSPLHFRHGSQTLKDGVRSDSISEPQVAIDSLNVYGHRLFGLPPSEPPYISQWDISAGDILGECSTAFVARVAEAAQALALTITDEENGLPIPDVSPLFDTTFVRWRTGLIRLWLKLAHEAFIVSIENVEGSFNDLATERLTQSLILRVPEIVLACTELADSERMSPDASSPHTLAYLKTAISMQMIQRPANFSYVRESKQDHIKKHDARTSRSSFLGHNRRQTDAKPPSLRVPTLPKPLLQDKRAKLSQNSGVYDRTATSRTPEFFVNQMQGEQAYTSLGSIDSKSSFLKPRLPSDQTVIDFSHVPALPSQQPPGNRYADDDEAVLFNQAADDSSVHTSLRINAKHGVVALCTPKAVLAALGILDALNPREPEAAFDQYQGQVASSALAVLKKQRGQRTTLDFAIDVPFVHMRVLSADLGRGHLNSETPDVDEYNVIVAEASTAVRIKSIPERKHIDDLTAVHLTIASINVSTRPVGQDLDADFIAFRARISNVLLWLADSDRTIVNASFNDLETRVASKELRYLAALIHRAATLVQELALPFLDVQAKLVQRRRFLAFSLLNAGRGVADPSFLTRPSYMIRSAQDHLRNTDSWKIVARLRWIFFSLNDALGDSLRIRCLNDDLSIPEDAETYTIGEMEQWRSWDVVQVKDSLAMQLLWRGHTDVEKAHVPGSVPLSVSIHGSVCKLAIDHGQGENEVTIRGIEVAAAVTPPPPPSAMQLFQEYHEVRLTTVHISSSRASVRLDWELCTLADDIATLFTEDTFLQNSAKISDAAAMSTDEGEKGARELHLVLQMDNADANVNAINVSQGLVSHDFKMSLVSKATEGTADAASINIVTSSREASLKTRGANGDLLETKLENSSLLLAYATSDRATSDVATVYIGGTAEHFHFSISEEPAGLVEVISQVVECEVRRITDLLYKHGSIGKPGSVTRKEPMQSSPLRANVALFLDSYNIIVALVQDVQYHTEGRVLRLAVAPGHQQSSYHVINFDLKAQRHVFSRGNSDELLGKSALDMPAINGSVRVHSDAGVTKLSVGLSVERINVGGLALYGISSMLSSTGVIAAFQSLYADVQSLQKSIESTFAHLSKSRDTPPDRPTDVGKPIFDASVVLVGIVVAARTRQAQANEPQISVTFAMESTHLRISNRSSEVDTPLPFPEIHLALGQMVTRVDSSKGNKKQQSACVKFALDLGCTISKRSNTDFSRMFKLTAVGPAIQIDEDTSPILINLLAHFQERMKRLDLSKERQYLRRLRHPQMIGVPQDARQNSDPAAYSPGISMSMTTSFGFRLDNAHVKYLVEQGQTKGGKPPQDLVFSLKQIQFDSRGEREARLRISEVKLQLLQRHLSWTERSANSALLPELIFTVNHQSTKKDRRLVFRAAGKALDGQAHPNVVQPAADLEDSLSRSAKRTRSAIAILRTNPAPNDSRMPQLPKGTKRLSLLCIDMNFAGAVVRLQEHDPNEPTATGIASVLNASSGLGRYNNLSSDTASKDATLRSPGIALQMQFTDPGTVDPCLNVELKVSESKNVLTPVVVPLILRLARNVKETMHHKTLKDKDNNSQPSEVVKNMEDVVASNLPLDESLIQRTPRALLGRTRLNVGVRISRQEFALICQPIAKVEARMKLEDSYLTVSTVDPSDNDNFFAASAFFTGMSLSLQHVYSRDPTFQFDIESIVISALNSKHVSGITGISAILKINPMKARMNAKQLQDVLLFREIWLPPEIRDTPLRNTSQSFEEQQEYFVSRYRQIAASTAFPWNATVAIADLGVDLDLGQAIGKLSSHMSNFWASSKKNTSAQQTLCVGIDKVSMDASGRMSGFILLDHLKVRTSIAWPGGIEMGKQTPLIQGSIGFKELRVKAAFDYQVFAIAHVTAFEFIMYNVRDSKQRGGDRLVAILDGDKIHTYCVASTAALAVSLAQAFERLIQERKMSYEQSLKDIDNFLRRGSKNPRPSVAEQSEALGRNTERKGDPKSRLPISLQTDVVVTLRGLDVGAFPRTVLDQQILRLDTSDVQARFAVAVEGGRLHSGLGLTLGQVRAALAEVPHTRIPKAITEVDVDDVVHNAISARGGVILRVPRVVAAMQTWQTQRARTIDYTFRSTFEGKIDVGWNYSRISFIRGMHATHKRTLATRLGKPLPESAVTITGPELPEEQKETGKEPGSYKAAPEQQSKITVTSNMSLPLSGYEYRPLEPVIIDTPQLRDMGDATPPLEWIGLHRDKLPNVTHQIVIVALLEVVKEVEDTYNRILGSA